MSVFEAWIGDFHLRQIEGYGEYHCQAAVWADSADTFRARLFTYAETQGYKALWVEECHPVTQYLHRHSNPHKIGPLARAVHAQHHVELSRLVAVSSGEPEPPQNYLIIEEIEGVEPLDGQRGVWPEKNIPDMLLEPLFGQPEPTEVEIKHHGSTEAVPPMKTYAILDARKFQWGFDEIEKCELPYRCLFKGEAAEDLKDVAPYIIELVPESSFTRRLFTYVPEMPDHMTSVHLWHKEPGIYIRSRSDFDTLWKHFRKFTKIQDEDGKWHFYRFWDLPDRDAIDRNKDRIVRFFVSSNDKIYNLRPNSAHVLSIPDKQEKQSAPFILTNEWKEKLAIQYQGKYVRGLLERDYKDVARTLNDDLKVEFSEHLARRFRHHRFAKSYSKETYLMAAILLGTRFDEDILYPEAGAALSQNKPCYLRMTELKTQIFRKRDEIYGQKCENYARALKRIAEQDEEQVLSLAQENKAVDQVLQLFPERARSISEKQLHGLIDICNTLAKKHFAEDERRFGAVVLLSHTFVLGAGCADDPLHDYLRKMLHSDEQEKTRKIFRYGQKRAKAQLKIFEKFMNKEREAENV